MTAICIASGPSLTQEDVDYCRGKGRVYVVNDTYRLAPWADVLYACDKAWWDHHEGTEFQGEKWTVNYTASRRWDLNRIGLVGGAWSNNPDAVASGANSGFQALNLAVIQGAARVILLGYDFGADEKKHWFGDHPDPLKKNSDYAQWIKCMNRAAPKIPVPVINCSRRSAIECFPKHDLREVL